MSSKNILSHSCEHLLAYAILNTYPHTLLGTDSKPHHNGFYYEVRLEKQLTTSDLTEIEKEMRRLISLSLNFYHFDLRHKEAISLFSLCKQIYKIEILKDIKSNSVSIYKCGNYFDLCRGPHIKNLNQIKEFKLLNISSSYWKSNKQNAILYRIAGMAFPSINDLNSYLKLLEESKKRDHRNLASSFDLFSASNPLIGAGLNIWLPNGAIIRSVIEDYLKKIHLLNGYNFVYSPHIASIDLWKTSGHWAYYKDSMYPPMCVDKSSYVLKPMNCPFHITAFKAHQHSYRDLPIRLAEFGTVYRYELPGVLHGLLRLRGFTQDDSHIFCEFSQIDLELRNIISLALTILKKFGFCKFEVTISTRPDKYIGTLKQWEIAEDSLKKAILYHNLKYSIDIGNGAFYGPKIDIKLKDSLNRLWQCSTIQLDFINALQFDINFINKHGKLEHPIIIHRALLGSFERFIGILIEEYAGAFPFWLAPEQIRILNISEKHISFSKSIESILKHEGFRVKTFLKNEPLSAKIRNAQTDKIPIVLIIGDKEISEKQVAIRLRNSSHLSMEINSLIAYLKQLE
ncbi:MAG: threonine--tRNA ligase [Deltaproteobacteria bacterium]|nr:MAG: threonine--tRNA ligase [Deltaproteobacteria bacterium]